MFCPKCSFVFDKEATKSLEGFIAKSKKRGKWSVDHRLKFFLLRVIFLSSITL